jgi:hypothetical protein
MAPNSQRNDIFGTTQDQKAMEQIRVADKLVMYDD